MTSIRTFNQQLLVPYTGSAKNHKLIQLPNGILTLLISDPSEDVGCIALCVASGAHNDPDEIPGLAHFCEHLLLLGSKNFPNPNEFHDTLSKAGGTRNAFTTGEQTCFFLEVPSNSTHKPPTGGPEEPIFNHLVKIFADCFKDPLFPESMFEKEIYAIDNEHTANKSTSGRMLYHGLRLMSNPDHKFSRFATGNFFTLNDLPKIHKLKVRDKLIQYYNVNYIPEKMTLVIRGSKSLNQLQKLAVASFGDFRPFDLQKKSKLKLFSTKKTEETLNTNDRELNEFDILSAWNYDSNAFTNNESNNCIFISSSKTPLLRLVFPLLEVQESSYELFKTAWANIVGDEGKGSLDHALKSNGYAIALSAYCQHLNQGDDVMIIEIKLTATGLKKLGVIISSILTTFKEQVFNSSMLLGRYLAELESIDLLNYLHHDSVKSPMQEASHYAQVLQKNLVVLDPKNILKGSRNWDAKYSLGTLEGDRYWTGQGQRFLEFVDSRMTVENLRFALLSNHTASDYRSILIDEEYQTKHDEFFNFDYAITKFNSPKLLSNDTFSFNFNIVDKNQFIPNYALNHLSLQQQLIECSLQSSNSSLSFLTKSDWSSTTAELVQKTDNFELWTKAENSKVFASKVFISFDIICTELVSTPLNTMCTEIVAELLKLRLSTDLYASELLNYTWEVSASMKGDGRFGFTVSGYTGGIGILLELIVSSFKNILKGKSITNDEFRKARVCVRSRYGDLEQNTSLGLAIAGILVVLEDKIWTIEDRLDALDDIDMDNFKKFLLDFENGSKFLKLVVQGNTKSFDSYSVIVNTVTNHLNAKGLGAKLLQPSTFSIPQGNSFSIERKGAKNDPMNAISFFIQTGARDDLAACKMTRLLSYLISLTLVPDLRFKRQLGYAVLGGTRILRSTIGIHISIMSGTFTPRYLERKINEYLLSWEDSFSSLSEDDFRITVIEPYVKNFRKNITSSGGPESLTSEMLPSVGSSNITDAGETMNLHKKLRDLIWTDSYDSNIFNFDEEELFISSLSKSSFMNFFGERLSVRSKVRSQLSVMIKSQLTQEETQQQLIRLQLEAFLKMNGLRISSEKLGEIVLISKANPVSLMKELFKHFIGQGESLRLLTVVLKEVVKQVSESAKLYKSGHQDSGTDTIGFTESRKIEDVADFQKKCSVYYLN